APTDGDRHRHGDGHPFHRRPPQPDPARGVATGVGPPDDARRDQDDGERHPGHRRLGRRSSRDRHRRHDRHRARRRDHQALHVLGGSGGAACTWYRVFGTRTNGRVRVGFLPHGTAVEWGRTRRRRGGGASEASWRIARGKGRLTRRRRQVAILIPGTRYSERQLADGAGGGHVELDETVHLDRVFHRELLDDGLDEPRHHHRRRLVFGEAAGHQIEELVLAHLRHGRLVTHLGVVLLHLHVRVGVGAAVLVEDQG